MKKEVEKIDSCNTCYIKTDNSQLFDVTKCEICGGYVYTPILDPVRHICDNCIIKLRKLLDIDKEEN